MLIYTPEKASDPNYEKFIDALKACTAIRERNKRDELINLLDNDIFNKVGNIESPENAVTSIISAFKGFPQKIDCLLKAIKIIEGESDFYNNLYEVIIDIACEQQEQKQFEIDELFKVDLNREFGIDSKVSLGNLDKYWSNLCQILNEIKPKYIWQTFNKLINFQKSNYWKKEKYIKSFCFTKNYKLLKRVVYDQNNNKFLVTFGTRLNQSLESPNQNLVNWLQQIRTVDSSNQDQFVEHTGNQEDRVPVLLIIIDQNANNWNVQAQLKYQSLQEKVELDENQDFIGTICNEFEQIPAKIESYINYLNNDNPRFEYISIDDLDLTMLRIEVFIPILNSSFNFDHWAQASEKSLSDFLVGEHRLFLRSIERIKRRNYKGMLYKGWSKLNLFLEECNHQSITGNLLLDQVDETSQKSNLLLIQHNNQINNWAKLTNFITECGYLWGVRLQDKLPENIKERGKFFKTMFLSGVPIIFWHCENITTNDLMQQFEDEFDRCLVRENLLNRCHNLLENTWRLRSNAWGCCDEVTRQNYVGYYFGMLLEDPEIMPKNGRLNAPGGRKY